MAELALAPWRLRYYDFMSVLGSVMPGPAPSEHLLQLFDEPESRAESVAAFLYEGWRSGAPLLVVARPANLALIQRRLEQLGCTVAATTGDGRLIVLDAATTLATFMRNGWPDAGRFDQHVGDVVARLAALGPHPWIYGEMVDILAEQANLEAAHELEMLWNQLCAQHSFALLCGYASGHFGDPRAAEALHRICHAHTGVQSTSGDILGAWLLNDRDARFQTSR
jgi:hypothetical protein